MFRHTIVDLNTIVDDTNNTKHNFVELQSLRDDLTVGTDELIIILDDVSVN